MFLLQVLGNVFSIFAIVMLIIGILIVMSVIVNGIEEDKENNNWQEMTRKVYKMRGKRTDTYYVYDAYTDELVGCGSLSKISELFEITPRTLKKYAENGNLYASRNADNLLKFNALFK